MYLDKVKKEILEEVQKEILEEKNFSASIQELATVWEFPFRVANVAFNRGIGIHIPVFGKFLFAPKLRIAKKKKELKVIYTEGSEEYKKAVLEAQLNFKKEAKARKNAIPITLEELKKLPVRNKSDKITKVL